ncbi:hypothetical protein Q7P36_008937 [Cladosporium allicinum]
MYEYRPLDRERKQIRLVILQPGLGGDTLVCTLTTAFLDLQTPPHYETVSYVCGDQTVKATINLHGSKIQVPATSEAALRRMRLKDRLRTLWIDALCINESDIEERGHQVGMMYEIYTQTSHNCIYLGLNDRNMPKVVASMKAILREISVETRDYVDFENMLSEPLENRKPAKEPFVIDIYQSGLLEFFQNPWFSRLWVVQEASLSRTSTCYVGRHRLSLVDVLRIAKWLCYKWHQISHNDNAPIGGIRHAGSIFDAADRIHGRCYRGKSNLWFLLYTFAEFHTFDRRDQVYALVALWQIYTQTSLLPVVLKPNYTLSVDEVLSSAARFAIQETNDLELLRDVYANTAGRKWPSWIPVLGHKVGSNHQSRQPRLGRFKADDRLNLRLFSALDESNTLDVAGVLIDQVTKAAVTKFRFAREIVDFSAVTMGALENLMKSTENLRLKSERLADLRDTFRLRAIAGDDYLRTTARRLADRQRSLDRRTLREAYENSKRHVEESSFYQPSDDYLRECEIEEETRAVQYVDDMRQHLGREVFYTKQRRVGLGREHIRPGDVVAILYGCEWPVVMRPLPRPDEYTFLECVYVHGIMGGEAVRRHREMGREDDRFRIV